MLTYLLIGYIISFDFCGANKNHDRIKNIPGLDEKLNFSQYSGYLSGVNENTQLHYWFVESALNTSNAPLVVWLNGGPGCSSLMGLLSENGPFLVGPNLSLSINPNAWNRIANVLYLESPAGVGFSYKNDNNLTIDDDEVASNNYAALMNFFKRFPVYKNRDFYLTGESYGGVYVPTLAILIAENPSIKLKGIAVVNGLLNYELNDNSLLYFAYYHGLLGERLWDDLLKSCCPTIGIEHCLFTTNPNIVCQQKVYEASQIIGTGFNIYNLYSPCAGGVKNATRQMIKNKRKRNFGQQSADWGNLFRTNQFVQSASKSLPEVSKKLDIECNDDSVLTNYLNSTTVRKALHIPDFVQEWSSCSEDVYKGYVRVYKNLKMQYLSLLKKKVRVHIINGDIDMACNFLGDEWFVNDLTEIKIVKPRSKWYFISSDKTRQIGGFTKTFLMDESETTLIYATVRGSGHMVPQDKPYQAFTLFNNFLYPNDASTL